MEDALLAAATNLREAIEKQIPAVVELGYNMFAEFPSGCCESANHLLAHYLVAQELCTTEQIQFPWNNYDKEGEWSPASHGWVALDSGWNVDITADQFSGVSDTVIVAKDSKVHSRFVGGEWVSFEEHHRRLTCHDGGDSFRRVWELLKR